MNPYMRNITTGQTWKYGGSALLISQVLDHVLSKKSLSKCNEIHVCASQVIYIDADWKISNISLGLSAPRIEVIGTEKRIFDTSGKDAEPTSPAPKGKDGVGVGISGNDGNDGEDGENAGDVEISCDVFHSQQPMSIRACGGKGSDGQHGGDGKKGSDGEDGVDGKLPAKDQVNIKTLIPSRSAWVQCIVGVRIAPTICHVERLESRGSLVVMVATADKAAAEAQEAKSGSNVKSVDISSSTRANHRTGAK